MVGTIVSNMDPDERKRWMQATSELRVSFMDAVGRTVWNLPEGDFATAQLVARNKKRRRERIRNLSLRMKVQIKRGYWEFRDPRGVE